MLSNVNMEAVFPFTSVTSDDILKEIKIRDIKKATQESDIPTKIIKQFPSLVVDFLNIKILIAVLLKVLFLMILKRQWYNQLIKKTVKLKNLTIDQLTHCRISKKFMKDSEIMIWPNVYVHR